MTLTPSAKDISKNTYADAHFGGNFLATKDDVGDEGTFDEAASDLGLETIRYPGGALTENNLGIITPEDQQVVDTETGEALDFVTIPEINAYAEEQGLGVTYVLPTKVFVGEQTDENGDRFAAVDEDAVRQFISSAMDDASGATPGIQAFEIGNEYWGAGEMSAVEYGRVSSEMATIIDDEMANHPNADQFQTTDILVQMGLNYGASDLSDDFDGTAQEQLAAINETYGLDLPEDKFIYQSGDVAWAKVNNEIILNEFDEDVEREAVDGVVAHVYSKGPETPNSRYYELSQIKDTWLQDMPELDVYVTEWNLKRTVDETRDEDYGLKQAHEMLNLMEAFDWGGVDAAHAWPVQMESRVGLTGVDGNETVDLPGEMFRLMSETLPGTRPMTLSGSEGLETELEGPEADVHAFHSDDRFVTFLASTSDEPTEQVVDFNNLVTDPGDVAITRLGVEKGENPTASDSPPVLTDENPEELLEDGILIADLAPREILVIEMQGPEYTEAVKEEAAEVDDPSDPDVPTVPPGNGDGDDNGDDNGDGDTPAGSLAALAGEGDDGGGALGALAVGLLPLLLLAA